MTTKSKLIINVSFVLAGFVLASAGVFISDWQWWAIIFIMSIVRFVSAIE